MKLSPLLIAFIVIAIGIVIVFWFFPKTNVVLTPEQKAVTKALSFENFLGASYSFSKDSDADGLSDAKEIIYGSDPLRPDTDGDGFLDGKEVATGFDPLAAGKDTGKLSERKEQSLTVQYFSWLQKKTENPDPPLKEADAREFLSQKGLLAFSLPPVLEYDIHFTNDDVQKITDYLTRTANLSLPEKGSPYLSLAGELIKNRSFDVLQSLLKSVTKEADELRAAPLPASLKDLHRYYVGIWEDLASIFAGLKSAQQDPVLVYLNQKKGEWLVEKIKEVEKLRVELISQMKLEPFKAGN
ncbi:MAG: hypothetical protein HYZ69_02230 [Candidatus Colwellbacteria bacterium]|nr:hypothetical protein [Candidatus Colwellbacteria bacterium]